MIKVNYAEVVIAVLIITLISIIGVGISLADTPANVPSFLVKTKTGYQEKPVILLLEHKDGKEYVMAAIFPDNTCIPLPKPEILALPHVFKEAPNGYSPCGVLN